MIQNLSLNLTKKSLRGLRFGLVSPSSKKGINLNVISTHPISGWNQINFNNNSHLGRLPCLRVSGGMDDKASEKPEEVKGKDLDATPSVTPPAAALPEPPEKPLPGDCCGSGCVRCVWDVYYEELEDYNNLIQTHSLSK